MKELSHIDGCTSVLIDQLSSWQSILHYTEVLRDYQSEYFRVDLIFKAMNSSREELSRRADLYAQKLAEFKSSLDGVLNGYNELVFQILKSKSDANPGFSAREVFQACSDRALDLTRQGTLALYSRQHTGQLELKVIEAVTTPAIAEELDLFFLDRCDEARGENPARNQRYADALIELKNVQRSLVP